MTEYTGIEFTCEVSGSDYSCTLSRHDDWPGCRVAYVFLHPIPGSKDERGYEYIQLFEDNPVVPLGQTVYEAARNARDSRAGRLWSPDVVANPVEPAEKP